jgi:hypothetical protein
LFHEGKAMTDTHEQRTKSANTIEAALHKLREEGQQEDGLCLLEELLQHEENNKSARFWLAYFLIHDMPTDDRVSRGMQLARTLLADPTWSGAAALLLASALIGSGKGLTNEIVMLLERSVLEEPVWVFNRLLLAEWYLKAGQRQLAAAAFEAVERSFSITVQPGPYEAQSFEELITGRLSKTAKAEFLRLREQFSEP